MNLNKTNSLRSMLLGASLAPFLLMSAEANPIDTATPTCTEDFTSNSCVEIENTVVTPGAEWNITRDSNNQVRYTLNLEESTLTLTNVIGVTATIIGTDTITISDITWDEGPGSITNATLTTCPGNDCTLFDVDHTANSIAMILIDQAIFPNSDTLVVTYEATHAAGAPTPKAMTLFFLAGCMLSIMGFQFYGRRRPVV